MYNFNEINLFALKNLFGKFLSQKCLFSAFSFFIENSVKEPARLSEGKAHNAS